MFPTPNRRLAGLLVTGAGLMLAATACGGDGSSDSSGDGGTSKPAAGSGRMVTVDETEFKLGLSTTTFSPGTYTFVAKNEGAITHALEVEGPGLEEETGTLEPGNSDSLTVKLEKGTYELYCPVDAHKARGMKTEITVG